MAQTQNHGTTNPVQTLMQLLVALHIRPGDVIDWKRVDLMWNAGGVSSPADLKSATDFAASPDQALIQMQGDQRILTQKGYEQGGGLTVRPTRWAEDIVEILAAFFNEHAGDSFTLDELAAQWSRNREHRPADLAAGLDYGVQQGWFTKTDDNNYTLTAKGRAQV